MNPPTPDEWLDRLPIWQVGYLGIGIYDGVVNDVDCPVVTIDETSLHIVMTRNALNIWRFNRVSGIFETAARGSAEWSSSVISAAGLSLEAGLGIAMNDVTQGDVNFKLIPNTP